MYQNSRNLEVGNSPVKFPMEETPFCFIGLREILYIFVVHVTGTDYIKLLIFP